jgi:hypothetical protein
MLMVLAYLYGFAGVFYAFDALVLSRGERHGQADDR